LTFCNSAKRPMQLSLWSYGSSFFIENRQNLHQLLTRWHPPAAAPPPQALQFSVSWTRARIAFIWAAC
jgi:hypothetical protein